MKYNIMIANSRLETKLHKIAMDEEEVRKRLANPIPYSRIPGRYLQMLVKSRPTSRMWVVLWPWGHPLTGPEKQTR